MKKIAVLVVLFALLVGVMPVSAETQKNGNLFNLGKLSTILSSPNEVQIGYIQNIDYEIRQVSLDLCVYSDRDNYHCLDFIVSPNTNTWVDWKMGKGNLTDLKVGYVAVVEYFLQDDMIYAKSILVLSKASIGWGVIRGMNHEKRIIYSKFGKSWSPPKTLYVPKISKITFAWDDVKHDFSELLLHDNLNVLYFDTGIMMDGEPLYIAPVIHVIGNIHRDTSLDEDVASFFIYAPLVIGNR